MPEGTSKLLATGKEWRDFLEFESAGRSCSAEQPLPANEPAVLSLDGQWAGALFHLIGHYNIPVGDGVGTLKLERMDDDGQFVSYTAVTGYHLGEGTFAMSFQPQPRETYRLKWSPICGILSRPGSTAYSNRFVIPDRQDQYFVSAYAATDDLPVIEQKRTNELQRIVVPLGSEFDVRLQRGQFSGELLPARFALTSQQVRQPLGRRYLFANSAVIAYGTDAPVQTKGFQAVHYGTASLRITPVDPSAPTVDVTVEVVPPLHLGLTQNTWFVDSLMLDAAHRSGLPPQTVKAQRKQEGPFSDDGGFTTLVYEPCRDIDTVQPLINSEPYESFTAPEPRGDELLALDLDGRQKYRIIVPGANGQNVRRPIQPTDVDVSIADIFEANDCVYRDAAGHCHGGNWTYTCNAGVIRQVRAADATDAQTPTSSSYGWFQVMYYVAIGDGWYVEDPVGTQRRNPHYLYDTPDNLAIGGGTLYFANDLNVKHWRRIHGDANESTTLQSYTDFLAKLRRMYKMYNAGWSTLANGSGPHFTDYGQAVLHYSREFLPIRSGSILR